MNALSFLTTDLTRPRASSDPFFLYLNRFLSSDYFFFFFLMDRAPPKFPPFPHPAPFPSFWAPASPTHLRATPPPRPNTAASESTRVQMGGRPRRTVGRCETGIPLSASRGCETRRVRPR